MTEEKQGAAELLRGIVKEYKASGAQICFAMAKMFGIDCEYETCKSCMVKLMTAIADRIDAERALPEGVEWPRFEDGELVKIGDEVEYGGKALEVDAICFDREELSMALRRNLDISRMSGSYDERVKRPTPKVLDADGAPIEVGDTVYLLEENGEPKVCGAPLTVIGLDCQQQTALLRDVGGGVDSYGNYSEDFEVAEHLTHRKPDSWERLEEDARKGSMCYARDILGINVRKTTTSEDNEAFARDLVSRAKALAKAGE